MIGRRKFDHALSQWNALGRFQHFFQRSTEGGCAWLPFFQRLRNRVLQQQIRIVSVRGKLVARYALGLGLLGKVLVENTGLRRAPASDAGSPAAGYFRGVFRFQAPEGVLQWLNDSVFINTGRREGNCVKLEVFRVL